MSKEQFSFNRGWLQVKTGDVPEIKKRLMSVLNIKTRAAWLKRLKGEVEPKVSEAKAIEEVFADYGIIEVWGAM